MSLFKKNKTEIKEIAPKAAAKPESKPDFKASSPSGAKMVLKQPWFSERATLLAKQNKYVFLVHENATKPSVRDEIQRRYGVRVTGVNIINRMGKMKHYGHKMSRRSGIKKAIVTLKTGDKIEIQ